MSPDVFLKAPFAEHARDRVPGVGEGGERDDKNATGRGLRVAQACRRAEALVPPPDAKDSFRTKGTPSVPAFSKASTIIQDSC
jgi:hypothetical protein